jgi:flagellar M-ring protein FliF
MDRLNGILEQIKRALGELTGTQKLLAGSLVVILAMTLFLVVLYTSSPTLVPLLPGSSANDQDEAARFLTSQGIKVHRDESQVVLVKPDTRDVLLAQMYENGFAPSDTTLYFNSLVEKQNWTMSSAQVEQQQAIALQNEVARSIGRFTDVAMASVVIDAPQPRSLGMAVRQPTASVNIKMRGNKQLSQHMIDGAAALVASSKAGLRIENVRVIDGNTGRQHRARSDDDMMAAGYLEHSMKIEQTIHDRLSTMLAYIPGVIIAVNAQVDIRRSVVETNTVLDPGKGTVTAPLRETTQERVQQSATRGAEPGVRPNTGLNINNAGAGGTVLSDTQTSSDFETEFGRRVERITDPRGAPLKIAATINIPRSFFVAQWRSSNDSTEKPADDELAPLIAQEVTRIRSDVQPQVDSASAGGAEGEVVVSVIPDIEDLRNAMPERFAAGATGAGAAGGVAGVLAAAGGVKTVLLSVLALAALGLMALTVRRATKAEKLPTAEELIGLPPALSGEADLVGEAGEADAALAGIELTDESIQEQKVLEQVLDMVKQRPAEAAGILNRWIQSDS